jgi:arylsulfatase A-like enzyme
VQRPRNLVFLMTDHQRHDSLGMVQCGREVAPVVTRLAAAGVRFDRAYNTCPLCAPARTALATGVTPTRNGVVFNDREGTTAGAHVPLHERLADSGYEVAHVGVHQVLVRPDLRQRVGWRLWKDETAHRDFLGRQGLASSPVDDPVYRSQVSELQGGRYASRRLSNARVGVWQQPDSWFKDIFFGDCADDYLRSAREPFALFVALWAPHPPLVVPESYLRLFPAEKIVLPPNVSVPAAGEPPGRRRGVAAQLAEGVDLHGWRAAWGAHLALVHLADRQIGRILSTLDEIGLEDSTLVVFTSDHGDHLGQHRMYQKMEMYEQAIRVPLVMRVPGMAPRFFDTPVSHLDVVPTVLDLLGLGVPAGLDGRTLAPAIMGAREPEEAPVYCQYSGDPAWGDTRRAVVTRTHKYVYDPADEPELYDLVADPLETRNIAADPAHAALLRSLHAAGRAWAHAHGDRADWDRGARTLGVPPACG